MKKITYKGSIAEDVETLKDGHFRPFVKAAAGIGLVALSGASLVTIVPPAVVVAGMGLGAYMGVSGIIKGAYNSLYKVPKAKKRVYKLLDSLGANDKVNEHDIKVAKDIPMTVKNVKGYGKGVGNYIVVNDGSKKTFIREVRSEDLRAYKQYVMDISNQLEAGIVANELEPVENVIILKK